MNLPRLAPSLAVLSLLLAPEPAPAEQADPKDTLTLLFVGDVNLARSVAREYIFRGRGSELFDAVRERIRAADVAVANLESIILERGRYADTLNSPVFAGPVESLELLRDAGFDVVGTANNHAWDFGRRGLVESLGHLDRAGLLHAGTGPTLEDAYRPVVIRRKGWTVALLALTAIFNYEDLTVVGHEAECCVAWADTTRVAGLIRAARDSLGADLVVAYVHAGLEYIPVPPLEVVATFRALARSGADAVIGHHPHVPQGLEYVDGRPVLYSLGNFVFRQPQRWTNRGLMAELVLAPGAAPRLSLAPLAAGYTPRFLSGADSAAVMAHVDSISRRIGLPRTGPRRNVARPSPPTTRP